MNQLMTRNWLRVIPMARRWIWLALLLLAPFAQAQTVLSGVYDPTAGNYGSSAIGYTLYPSPGITEAFIQVGTVLSPNYGTTAVTTSGG